MAPQLRVLAVLPELLGLILRTHVATQNCLELQFQGIRCPLLDSERIKYTSSTWIYIQAKQHTYKMQNIKLLYEVVSKTIYQI